MQDPVPSETTALRGPGLRRGFDEGQRAAAARLYWDAFGDKLGVVLGPEPRALALLQRVLRPDHCFAFQDDRGRLVGIAGFKSPEGSFAGGRAADMRAVYGPIGAAWRLAVLWLLSREVDNRRFLVDGIAVAESHRGHGVGTALLDALCDEARGRGYDEIRLEVIDRNSRARALYERKGFTAIRIEKLGALGWIFGFASATVMVRPLQGLES
ncbi:GNAT family N-acetyltransferase [Pseudogemmobacter sonorensis]|uniref:GNAT family N-acetyltransferase n=1 Tax=Pseudogemmobacter sonorensis TaxID=2989681 RepID=UPI0036B42EEB